MKTILISDINGKRESVIPYALNFTKYIDEAITIIHSVDPMIHQAVASAYADSQSFQVGSKLSHAEILEREKHKAGQVLDKLLSTEASKINFPLRVKPIIEEKSMVTLLNAEIELETPSMIICTSDFQNTALHSFDELMELANKFNSLSLIVPPGHSFSKPERVLVQHDVKSAYNNDIQNLLKHLKPFDPLIQVVEAPGKEDYATMALNIYILNDHTQNGEDSMFRLKISNQTGKHYAQKLLAYIQNNDIALFAVPKKSNFFKVIANHPLMNAKQWIEEANIPLLFY